jgi:hypothetical protein
MYRKPVSVKLDLAVLKSRGINWTRRCHVLETCGYERVKIAVLGPVALGRITDDSEAVQQSPVIF